jgi:hypothetical protein
MSRGGTTKFPGPPAFLAPVARQSSNSAMFRGFFGWHQHSIR